MDHKVTVEAIYAAFGRGDVPAILEKLAPDVAWESWQDNFAQREGVPWMAPRSGREGALEFFKIIGGFRFQRFEVLSILAGGDQVAAECVVEAEVPATGARFKEEEMHLWTFDAHGRVKRFRHYLDTAKHIALARSGR